MLLSHLRSLGVMQLKTSFGQPLALDSVCIIGLDILSWKSVSRDSDTSEQSGR